ncbi:MAG: glycosyltransferase family 4 protein [Solirubrobacteraceae bacterium]
MRILLINYRYFISGGPERYMFNVEKLLEMRGHEVIPFSIRYARNEPSEYSAYFAAPLTDETEVYFRDQSRSIGGIATSLERAFYSPSVYKRLRALISDTRPDVAIVLHYLRKLSPSVLKSLADAGVPFVVRLSDFAMICPNAHLVREGQICELCVSGSQLNSVRHGCVQGSVAASAVNYAATLFHRRAGYFDLIPRFIAPSSFTIRKMIAGGWDPGRLVHIPTFVWPSPTTGETHKSSTPTIVYVGRIEPLKGVKTLLEAVSLLAGEGRPPFSVELVGEGAPDFVQSLRAFSATHGLSMVSFAGGRDASEVGAALRRAWCSVVPSLWYENMPNSALESMAQGTAVIASDHGSLPELVEPGRTGLLFPPGDPAALAAALGSILDSSDRAERLGAQALDFVSTNHSPDRHYDQLIGTLTSVRELTLSRGK